MAISAICEAETCFGLEKKDSRRLWQEYHSYLENKLLILPVDKNVAAEYGRLRAMLESGGTPRTDLDLLIAATARHHGLILATLNPRHFEGIPGLQVETW